MAGSGLLSTRALASLIVVAILFVIGITIIAPLVNGLTTGATPTIAPTSTTGTLVGYIVLFLVLAFIVGILVAYISVGKAVNIYQKYKPSFGSVKSVKEMKLGHN